MTTEAKRQALENALLSFEFPDKFFIHQANKGKDAVFTIASRRPEKGIETYCRFMNYDEMNSYLKGFNDAKTGKIY